MKLFVAKQLERFFDWLEHWAGDTKERVSFCSCCGRNRYTGKPCVGEKA